MGANDLVSALIDQAEEWMTDTPQLLADMFLAGDKSPFAAPLSDADKIRFYEGQFFNPDGTPNVGGRNAQLNRLGVADYMKVLEQMSKLHESFAPPPEPGSLP